MSQTPDPIAALRDALKFSPDNIPLRLHLANTLVQQGDAAEAEQEYLQALAIAPQNLDLKLGLVRAFYQQDKDSKALVLLENLIASGAGNGEIFTWHARLLLRQGNVAQAVAQMHRAIALDPSLANSDLAERLGISPNGEGEGEGEVTQGRVRAQSQESEATGIRHQPLERPSIRFHDVGGMDALKEEIRLKIIYPLTHADLYKAYGKSLGGGILMYGPPGCGKTLMARATAGEIESNFIAVGLNDILDMWIGNSEKNLHQLFEQARRNAPCVLFFDEVDALAASRADLRQSAGRQLINQFLAELDGVHHSNDGVLILAATNAPWHLDAAFRRPGRFDRILFVPPPDAPARCEVLRLLCKGKPTDNIDFAALGKQTAGLSGADLQLLVDLAVEQKLQDAMQTGIPKPLTTKDLIQAAGLTKSSTREWFGTARNYAIHANQDGAYDEILKYLKL
jgi:transitional endoplasmic reticulum ATPase